MKVGDRIDVFKVLTDGEYADREFTPNTYRVGIYGGFASYVLGNAKGMKLAMYDDEAIKVGTLIIKTIK